MKMKIRNIFYAPFSIIMFSWSLTFDLTTMNLANYERQLFKESSPNSFILPWGQVLLRNLSKKGDLLLYANHRQFRKSKVPVWICCKVLIFRSGQRFYPVYDCNHCDQMKHLETLTVDQEEEIINTYKCIHSKMADIVMMRSGEQWQDLWEVDLTDVTPEDQVIQVSNADHIKYQTLREDNLFLAAVKSERLQKISILHSTTKLMKNPVCSNCSTRSCRCFYLYKRLVREEQEEENPGVPVTHFWDRICLPSRQREAEEDYNVNHRNHNKKKILFPPSRDPELSRMLDDKRKGELQYPERFVPEFNISAKCKHGNGFDPLDQNLILLSEESTIYSVNDEEQRKIPVYGRGTGGACLCVEEPDTLLEKAF